MATEGPQWEEQHCVTHQSHQSLACPLCSGRLCRSVQLQGPSALTWYEREKNLQAGFPEFLSRHLTLGGEKGSLIPDKQSQAMSMG